MSFSRIRGAGFSIGSKLLSSEMTQLDIDHAAAVDGVNGGVCTLASKLTFDGVGGFQANKLFLSVAAKAGNYTLDASEFDCVLTVDTTSATPTYAITLTAAVAGRVVIVKHLVGTPPLLVTPNGTNTIEGINANYTLQQIGSCVTLLGVSSTAWIVTAKV